MVKFRYLFSLIALFGMMSQHSISAEMPIGGEVPQMSLPSSSSPSESGVPQGGFPVWTPCKGCQHVWYLTCRNPGKKGCIVDGKEISWEEFVKRVNRRAKVVSVEKLRNGTVIVWFKW